MWVLEFSIYLNLCSWAELKQTKMVFLDIFLFLKVTIQNVFSVCLSESLFDGFSTRLLMFPFPGALNRTERATSHMLASCKPAFEAYS